MQPKKGEKRGSEEIFGLAFVFNLDQKQFCLSVCLPKTED